MKNEARVKAAQTRAKKLIEQYENLGWEIPNRIKERADMTIPSHLSDRQAQAIIDGLSAETIRVTRQMSRNVVISDTEPIVSGHYKSGAKIFDVLHMDDPSETVKEESFTERNAVKKTMDQIHFVMTQAPNRDAADKIYQKLWSIELHGSKIFNKTDRKEITSNVEQSIISSKAIEESVKNAEKSGFPATQALQSLYADLLEEYGKDERGLAARQMKQFESVLESVGMEYSTDPHERQTASDVLRWLIENDNVWQSYRKQFKLKKIYRETYDSNSLLVDVSDVLVDHPKYRMMILNKLVEFMNAGIEPWNILDRLEEYIKELQYAENS